MQKLTVNVTWKHIEEAYRQQGDKLSAYKTGSSPIDLAVSEVLVTSPDNILVGSQYGNHYNNLEGKLVFIVDEQDVFIDVPLYVTYIEAEWRVNRSIYPLEFEMVVEDWIVNG